MKEKNISITTATVELKVIQINNKKMTLAVFRQLPITGDEWHYTYDIYTDTRTGKPYIFKELNQESDYWERDQERKELQEESESYCSTSIGINDNIKKIFNLLLIWGRVLYDVNGTGEWIIFSYENGLFRGRMDRWEYFLNRIIKYSKNDFEIKRAKDLLKQIENSSQLFIAV